MKTINKKILSIGMLGATITPLIAIGCETNKIALLKPIVKVDGVVNVARVNPLASELAKLQDFTIDSDWFEFISKLSKGQSIRTIRYRTMANIRPTSNGTVYTVPNYNDGYGLNAPLNASITVVVVKTPLDTKNRKFVLTVYILSHGDSRMASKDINITISSPNN